MLALELFVVLSEERLADKGESAGGKAEFFGDFGGMRRFPNFVSGLFSYTSMDAWL